MINKLRLAIYLAALAGCVVWISFTGGAAAYMTFFAVLFYLPAACLYALYSSLTLHIWQGLPEHKVTKQEEETFRIILENTGFLPVNAMKLVWEEDLCKRNGIPSETVYYLRGGERMELSCSMTCLYAGTYPVGAKNFLLPDAFGILKLKFRVMHEFRAIVRPRITNAADERLSLEDRLSTFSLSDPVNKDDILGNDIRMYIPGDPMRQIHWKNTARSGELMVRLPKEKEIRLINVILVPERPPYEFDGILRRDRFLEFAVSAAAWFGRQSKACMFIYPHATVRHELVDDMPSFYRFYEDLSDGIYFGREEDQENGGAAMIEETRRSFDERSTALLIFRESEF
ncbi:MAG: DUF58 domain-containing protein [Lachnospiraceae bacterium]|nr:DUF58 domain-containing protein [Lachnospiraceae bacterium]